MSSPQDTSGEPNFFAYFTTIPPVPITRQESGVVEAAALVGERIFYQRARQNVRGTYMVWQRVGAQRQAMFCGTDGTVQGEYQVDVYGLDDVLFVNAASAIRRALVDYSGPMGAAIVKKVLLETDFDSVDPEPGLLRRTQTYTVWYAED